MKKKTGSAGANGKDVTPKAALHAIEQSIAECRIDEARSGCERLLAQQPRNTELLHRLGIILITLKDSGRATQVLEQAARHAPKDARLHNDLGIAFEKNGEFGPAEEAYRKALRLAPNLPEAHSNLADLLLKMERPGEAIPHAQKGIELKPTDSLAWQALGDALLMHGKTDEAIATYEKAIQLPNPQLKAFTALARTYVPRGRRDEAIKVLREGRTRFSDDPKILNDLGLALGSMKRYEEAQELFETAYRHLQEPATLYNVLTNLGFMKKSAEMFALENEVLKQPQPNVALSPLFGEASASCNWGLQERLLPHFMQWCAMDDRKLTAAGQNMLLLMPIPSVTPAMIKNLAERIAATHRRQTKHYEFMPDHAPAMSSQSKLRIGYLSGDFKLHVVNYFASGQFSHYDKQYLEVYCYSNLDTSEEDEITDQYRAAVDRFINVTGLDEKELVQQINNDGIHVLIDLAGYTGASRLNVMCHRPAPVQMTYLGYPFTTGLKEVDYVLSDPWLNGPENAAAFVEQNLEISPSFISSGKLPASRENLEPPFLRNDYITFGSFNNCYKLNRPTIAVWSRILTQVVDSRLVLNNPRYKSPLTQENIFKEFEQNGIPRERIAIVTDRHPKGIHLYWYQDIDISLDAFPQTGGTTTFESLWMGVPVVTLVGSVHYERLSYSIMKNCGTDIDDLIAFNTEEYVNRAVALARNRQRIANLHAMLSRNMRESILFDPARQVRHYEDSLIEGWNRKFPDQPKFTPETFVYTRLNTPAVPLVATVSDPDNLYRYVIHEQGRWFAPEYGMLEKLAQHLQGLAVEIGGEPGFFSLELARTGMQALSLSTSTVAGRLIRAAAEKDGIGERIEVRLESARTSLLDRAKLENVGLLRIGVEANDGNAGPIVKNPLFWKSNAPLVLLSVHSGNGADLSTAVKLSAMGYRLYRLLPGLGCFAPYSLEEALDPYTLYLLACPPEREPPLITAGILVPEPEPIPPEEVAALSNAGQTADPWQQMDEWVVHCTRKVHDSNKESGVRLGYLQLALKAQQTLVDSAPSTTRRISLARLLSDIGRRAEAISLLNQSVVEIEQGSAQVTLPFLAPSGTWDDIPPGDRLAEWLFAGLIETRCRLAAHSTYFLSANELEPLDLLPSVGFETDFSRNVQRARLARQGQG